MSVAQPSDIHRRFAEAMAANDVDALADLYEPAAVLVAEPGVRVQGRDAIRAQLGGMLALGLTLEAETTAVIEAGDIAMLRAKWRMRGAGQDGSPVELAGESTEVLRRQGDGTWRCIIDSPYGGG